MDTEKIIIKLSAQVDNLNAHINRLKKIGYKTHILDVDMLRQKTIELYELVCELETFTNKKVDTQKPDLIAPRKNSAWRVKGRDRSNKGRTNSRENYRYSQWSNWKSRGC